ncbi:unnamed protein product [Linum trigynum]|uniref:RNase H type-1 domain-containing protein n=1 Tax=Linum trigynum TaxID=586398 RepID=A0AAV2GI49_9ROSI
MYIPNLKTCYCVGNHKFTTWCRVFKDVAGSVLWAHGVVFDGIVSLMLAELLALWEAVQMFVDAQYHQVFVVGDAMVIIDKVVAGRTGDCSGGAVYEDIRRLVDLCPDVEFQFVGWQNNTVAYGVAKKAIFLFPQ